MNTVSPPTRDVRLPVIPFSHGVAAYHDGYPSGPNLYEARTVEHARFMAGRQAAALAADGKAAEAAASGTPVPDASFNAVVFVAHLQAEHVPAGLAIRPGATVTNPESFVAYLRGSLALDAGHILHRIATDDARDLCDAFAAHRTDDAT